MQKGIISFVIIVCAGVLLWLLVISGSDKSSVKPSDNRNSSSLPLDQAVFEDRVFGNKDAKNILIEYSDFQCPACAYYGKSIDPVLNKYSNQVKFVYRHFPLSYHKNAKPAGAASEAAGEQGKFFEMARILFQNQTEWENLNQPNDKFNEYAKTLGLIREKFKSDLTNPKLMSKIELDFVSGSNAGVDGTPTFFLNGNKLDNLQGIEDLDSRLNKLTTPNN